MMVWNQFMNVVVAGVKMKLFDVYVHVNSGDLELIDTVYFHNTFTSEMVRDELIFMGYDETICVVEHVEGGVLD
jgi:hypothetical protein